jgi:UDP:flavonoid glycosyltransferase YjiC (YdhE family)
MALHSGQRRILLTTFGSLGDLHPFLAIAGELAKRGHHPMIGTVPIYRERVESAGFEFRCIRAALIEQPDQALIQQAFDLKNGGEYIVRNLVMPALRTAYEDTLLASRDAHLLVSHPLTFATRLVAEKLGLPWASTQLAPMGFFSAYDPPVLPIAPLLAKLYPLGPLFFRPLMRYAKRSTRGWTEPYTDLCLSLGLQPIDDPLFDGSYSPSLVLGLFSDIIGSPQPDWPKQASASGFPFFDEHDVLDENIDLHRFLDAGPPPIVFTLGTAAVMDSGRFYQDSVQAAQALGKRALLLIGRDPKNRPENLPDTIAAFEYAPFAHVFPRAAAIVHQGGIGTTAQAMRAGKPMLLMPYALDQPDNAARVQRLGIAKVLPRARYSADRATRKLDELLKDPTYSQRAHAVSQRMVGQSGREMACDLLEPMLN